MAETVVVGVIVAVAGFFAARSFWKGFKQLLGKGRAGQSACACSGSSGCSGCPMAGAGAERSGLVMHRPDRPGTRE